MRYALAAPDWDFEGSIYFGCREPHLPLEFGYARRLLEREGHEVLVADGLLEDLSGEEIAQRVADFRPDFTVLTTAPSYLFWRCAPPELRVPIRFARQLRRAGGALAVVGPHGSTTPETTLRKLEADIVLMGECEELLPRLVDGPERMDSVCFRDGDAVRVRGGPHASDMASLPAPQWPDEWVRRHLHHHHRFDSEPLGPGAEIEASRGCPYHCTFCAKDNFRNLYRRRVVDAVLEELDRLLAQGVQYVYFIDEIFLPNRELLEGIARRKVKFGVQTRIDLWGRETMDLLGRAGCVSVEAGMESLTEEGRERLDKKCRLSTDEMTERLIYAKSRIPFVQANLIAQPEDSAGEIEAWRGRLRDHGVWANKPVPLFPYPGSPEYTRLWGRPDERAWERAHRHYLGQFSDFSDIQETAPAPLHRLELVSIEPLARE
jgi:anaerobic magnesium-protoporphyrin IX monomethyl ester cyclase